jgi:hypothetical protein
MKHTKRTIVIEIDTDKGALITQYRPTQYDNAIDWQIEVGNFYVLKLIDDSITKMLLECKRIAPKQYVVKKSIGG